MEQALRILLEKLKGIDFALIGTFNLFLQGVKVSPHDLDILTDDEGMDKISRIFGSKITLEKEDRYKETKFKIGDTEVHVVSNKNNPLRPQDFRKQIVWVKKGDLEVPCMSLESELRFYQQVGRSKDRGKIDLIQAALKQARESEETEPSPSSGSSIKFI